MSKQLKFRVWDLLKKSFIYPDSFFQEHYTLNLNGQFYNLQNGSGGDEYEVNQFTGFKDDDNDDIYEGDILRWSEYQGWEDGRTFYGIYVVEWNEKSAKFQLVDPFDGPSGDMDELEFDTVIGNIYETPNLLPNDPTSEMTQLL